MTPRTVLRGGYGIGYTEFLLSAWNGFRNPPFVSLYSVSTTPLQPLNRLSGGLPAPVPTDPSNPQGDLTGVARDMRLSYAQQMNLTLQREVLSGLVWTASYLGNYSRKLAEPALNVNVAMPGPGAIQPRRPFYSTFPGVAGINFFANQNSSNFTSFQTSIDYRARGGLNLMSNYTWAHVIEVRTVPPGSSPAYPKAERGNSSYDVRHRWTVRASYELPFGRSLAAVLKGWQINGITVAQSGRPYTISNSAPRANTGAGDRPNQIGNPHLPSSQRTTPRWFNTGAFAVQPLYTAGNVGSNTMPGPGLISVDFSLFKKFALSEKLTMQFRAEVFNLPNHPNFGVPSAGLGTASFGVINSTENNLPRNLQFAVKLLF